jgi:hypothetical protein
LRPTLNLEGHVPVFMFPSDRVTQLYPQTLGCLAGYGGGILISHHTTILTYLSLEELCSRNMKSVRLHGRSVRLFLPAMSALTHNVGPVLGLCVLQGHFIHYESNIVTGGIEPEAPLKSNRPTMWQRCL